MRSFNVDDKLKNREIIKLAITETCKNKKKKKKGKNKKYKLAQYILANIDLYIDKTLEIITAFEKVLLVKESGGIVDIEVFKKAYKAKKCETFITRENPSKKSREITSSPLFPDQVIHQLVVIASKDILMGYMYKHSYGSIPGRGIHKGVKYMKKIINHHNKVDKSAIKYGGQLDIKSCYETVQHDELKRMLKRKFRGKLFLGIVFEIIDSYKKRTINGKAVGLPIGYSTSHWFCNFLLTPLDYYIKQELGIEYYLRYMDDMSIWGRSKKKLHQVVRKINQYLKSIGMQLKHTWQVFRFDYEDPKGRKDKQGRVKRRGRAFDTLGYRFFRHKTILRKRNSLAIKRQVMKVSRMKEITVYAAQSLMSRLGQLRHFNSYRFYHKYVKPFISIRKLKEVIRNESRKYNNACLPVRN